MKINLAQNNQVESVIISENKIGVADVNSSVKNIRPSQFKILDENRFSIVVKDQKIQGHYVYLSKQNKIQLNINGYFYDYEILSEGQLEESIKNKGNCISKLPGKVLKIHVEKNQQVKTGEILIVTEAMKMEHTMIATFDCIVKNILVTENMQITSGQVLIELEEI